VFETKDRCVQRNIDDVVHVQCRHSSYLSPRTKLRAHHSDHAKPLFVDFDVLVNRIRRSEQIGSGSFPQYADRLGSALFTLIEETTLQQVETGYAWVTRTDA